MDSKNLIENSIKKACDYGVSKEVFDLVRDRIKLIKVAGEDIIICHEISGATEQTVKVHFDKVDELSEDLSSFCVVVDLSDADRPDAKTRAVINKRFYSVPNKVKHIAFCIKGRLLIRTALRFVLFGSTINNYSVCDTLEQAFENCKKAIPRQAT